MKTLIKLTSIAAIAAAMLAGATSLVAGPINGSITFNGTVQLSPNSISTATVAFSPTTKVASVAGDFSSFVSVNDIVALDASWTLNSGPVSDFWVVDGFHFDLSSSAIVPPQGPFLNVSGSGIVWGNGFTPTSATWSFTIPPGSAGNLYSFAAATVTVVPNQHNPVPDSGVTALLLGLGLVSLNLVARRFKKA
jgi:hypothetical protein